MTNPTAITPEDWYAINVEEPTIVRKYLTKLINNGIARLTDEDIVLDGERRQVYEVDVEYELGKVTHAFTFYRVTNKNKQRDYTINRIDKMLEGNK